MCTTHTHVCACVYTHSEITENVLMFWIQLKHGTQQAIISTNATCFCINHKTPVNIKAGSRTIKAICSIFFGLFKKPKDIIYSCSVSCGYS